MKVTFKNNVNLSLQLKKLTKEMANNLKNELIDVAAEIDQRTANGKDINGNTFKAYAPSTKKMKEKTGRQSSPPNLTQTGKMLNAAGKVKILETSNKITGIIGFSSAAEAEKGKWNQESRPWFGLS